MTIVVGHDGSDSGDDAAALGAQLAQATDAALIVVSVYPEENPVGLGRVDAEWVGYMREQAEEVSASARRFVDERGAEATFRVVGSSSAAHGLDDVAEQTDATMIVVGSSRHGARRRISPGSTGERLLHGAICPVAVAPRGWRDRPAEEAVRRIGVAYLDAPEAREALNVAAALVQRTGASLTLYTVVAPRAEIFSPVIGRDAEESFLGAVREGAREALDRAVAGLPFEAADELLEGDVVDCLAALDERECDLLVCGSRGYGPVRRVLLGGVASRLVRRAACPVVVVPRGAE
ncbi:universal stress protein [Solirubrobacter sp. CPCC 204708]|uniref:Universal stress protein n=1 Tax=Solirubrobacter deserti TaxID=2282478 RepID=A0ABT4RRH0_9ACTN|nr:universal stress protein [Solirubrobacter deserti]MBE2314781.1 universal stress protein [Solirubrobacter deserti]MDA0141191.1 universal stress protein [Solirubrobacter deserti]